LINEYQEARSDTVNGLRKLEYRLSHYEDPESVKILQTKTEKEKEYLQRTIILMELKQIAESITMIAFRKTLSETDNTNNQFKNRPLLWQERIAEEEV
jgi:hypothetical protein